MFELILDQEELNSSEQALHRNLVHLLSADESDDIEFSPDSCFTLLHQHDTSLISHQMAAATNAEEASLLNLTQCLFCSMHRRFGFV